MVKNEPIDYIKWPSWAIKRHTQKEKENKRIDWDE
jgi:hypothetical protein